MNCIFICVFYEKKYVDMLYLLLESIFIYGNLDENTNILIYTSTLFMNIIKKSHLFNSAKIMFEINDTYNSIDSACKARLDLFNLPSISNYNKILYLDTDILVKDCINKVFDVCQEDILYALEEGEIYSDSDYWGRTLFGREIHNYRDKTAFSSGVLLFNNCEKIKGLFRNIKEDIIKRPYNFVCYDQPYIVYNAFKYNLYNNKVLKSLVVNNDTNIHSNKVIHHFPGGPGSWQHKIVSMTEFLNRLKNHNKLFKEKNKRTDILLSNLVNIEHDIWTCSSKMRCDIYEFFKDKSELKIAEIGSHKGYSTKVLSKIFSKVYAVDNSVEWTKFNKNFNKDATNIEYVMLDIYKDSWEILPDDIEVSFIDACHSYECCKSDILNSIKQFKKLQYIIFDDYGVWNGVKKIIDEMIENNTFIFEKFIGLNDVPGPSGIVKNVNEGVICRVNRDINFKNKTYSFINKTYSWENSYIKFIDNFKMDAFGEGNYKIIDKQNIIANFGGRIHNICFNIDYTEFSSIRKDDLQTLNGKIIDSIL
jgi:lipopolysaccharide biosynthesis glycosyltransferase